jgi:hypothetical protein
MEELKNKLRILQDKSRRNNLMIHGIKETWNDCENIIRKVLKTSQNCEEAFTSLGATVVSIPTRSDL